MTDIPLHHVFSFINTNALFRGQWGFKQGKQSPEEFERSITDKAEPVFRDLQKRATDEGWIEPKVVYGYFPVQAESDELRVFDPGVRDREVLRFKFPRQDGRRRLCIADFFRPAHTGEYDVLALQVVTIGSQGDRVRRKTPADDKYQEYLYIHGFGVESAEALAEFWHKRIRQELGFGSDDASSVKEIFQQGYRGSALL